MISSNIGVVVAHPDDEVLAFGGLMARHAAAGQKVFVLILATGLSSRTVDGSLDAGELAKLQGDARKANEILGVSEVQFGDFPDNRMDTVALLDVVKRVEVFLREVQASTVYTHHDGDMNIDHGVVSRAVLTSCRTLPGSAIRKVYSGEVLSSSEYTFPERRFQPTSYSDITGFVDRKCEAMACYRSELRALPHPRSLEAIRAQAVLRGSEAGVDAAEALCVLRELIP